MNILVGMSGGIDSTYAAYKLISEGHTVAGAVLSMHGHTEIDAASAACESLGIPLCIINCRELFERTVISNFIDEYRSGRTPNPCIICNSEVKFEALLDYAVTNGFDRIATGHYARVESYVAEGGNRYFISCAADKRKDQAYMLWRLSQRVLERLVLPLSDITKEEVRRESERIGLVCWDREDSQEICFIPQGHHADFIRQRTEPMPEGDFVDEEGRVLGRHKGIVNYTVGQRKGLGISLGVRAFVSEIDSKTNRITLSDKATATHSFSVSGVVFSGIEPPEEAKTYRLRVKYRYLSPKIFADVTFFPDARAEVVLDEPAKALAPGQSVVFYLEDGVAAGGFID